MGKLHAAASQRPGDLVAKGVIAQLAQQRTAPAQPGNGGADIGRSTAHPGAEGGHFSKLHPTREGIISISASPMENKILSDIGLLPFCIQVCRKVRQCTVYTRKALCATASFIR